ncbi:phage portal protein [Paraclostridium bifermentans]|uniref:phage portal protein n=1 Tax=Paraclostridium bifermentans TaxID=1490 RepID=UPI00359C7522
MRFLNIDKIKEIIKSDNSSREDILKFKKYYDNEGDIKATGVALNESDPLRNADNRISHNFHQLLVDEKASYMFTYPVIFNIGSDKKLTDSIVEVLGDDFESISKETCIEASNCGIGWIHYWINDDKKTFNYALVPTEQIIPRYNNTLKKELKELYRYYSSKHDNNDVVIFEHWTNEELVIYTLKGSISVIDKIIDIKTIKHKLEQIPFIPFFNNKNCKSDLSKYKDLIDLYDRVMSGFANDLEDIQQIIYILENYGGTDLKEFLGELKRYKTVKTESDGTGNGGGLKTLQIEIPVEARKVILDILKKQIYESGQGLQQDTESFGNASGVALKFFYRKLELKSGFTETEFKKGFATLIRAILRYLKKDDKVKITQTYTRNMISNDLENSEIARNSVGIIPEEIIIRNHPWIEDPEEALELLRKEEQRNEYDPYETPKGKEVDE